MNGKENPKASDLIVSTDYVANINGKEIKAPMVTTKDNTTATVSTTIDVTPLVKQMTPNWEIGTGVGYENLKNINYAVSLQRNYKQGKSIELMKVRPKVRARLTVF